MKKISLSLITILILNSCASILNGERTSIKISSDNESKIVFNKDTLTINRKRGFINPIRSKKTLTFTVLKDSLKDDFYLKPKLSNLFWANISFNYGVGMLVDLTSDKRFTHKQNLHFITDTIANKIILSNKKIAIMPKNKLLLYTSPLQFLDFFSIPMPTLGTEYFIKKNISLSAEYGFRNSNFRKSAHNISYLKGKASTYRFETKFYNKINLTNNVHLNEYLSLEFREIKSQYNDIINYSLKDNPNQDNYSTDDFATKKTVTIINLKYGFLVPIGKTFYLDFYSGFGVRIKNFNHINLEYDKSIHQVYGIDDFGIDFFNEFKNYTQKSFLNYSLGFKFGIKL
jgi:hypothetical protein